MLYDAAIIGTGPAGLSAAINLKLHDRTVLWLGSSDMSGKVERSERIRNYPGFPEITGEELNRRLREHAASLGLEITDRMVTNVMASGSSWMILAQNELYQSCTLLLATGAVGAKGFDGETDLLGRGVSYCATCDGFLYRGKTIAVFCGNPRYEHEVRDLAGLAEKVYLCTSYPDCGIDLPNVIRLQKPIRRVLNEQQWGKAASSMTGTIASDALVLLPAVGRLAAIELRDGSILAVDGLFCLRDSIAPATLVPGLALEGPHIVVNRRMETNLPGCYAAGDCTGRPYQIAKSVGEGNTAAHSMLEYLSRHTVADAV